MSVRQDTGRPWAAAAAALLVIHGVAAGMRRVASHNGDYGTLGILVKGGWSGGWSDGRRSGGMSPDWLINYPMQAVHPVYRLPVVYCNGIFC